jgi:N-carbamoylputrescine amidase
LRIIAGRLEVVMPPDRSFVRITVCEISSDEAAYADTWKALREHTARERSDLLLLPEFAFLPAVWTRQRADPDVWTRVTREARDILDRLPQLSCKWVVGAGPAMANGKRKNQGFAWSAETGARPLRCKSYLPDEAGSWERQWFEAGLADFDAFAAGPLRYGLNICTELWALDAISRYPSLGIQAIMTPRATARDTTERWISLAKTVAVRAGAFSLSSNRRHADGSCGGTGWIIDPEGRELARTSAAEPFVTRELDLRECVRAQATYPRYVFADA